MKKTIVLLLITLFSISVFSQGLNTFFAKTNRFLNKNVFNGKVAYGVIHKNSNELETILEIAKGISVSKEDSKNYQAFWINAYNLAVIKGIIDNYPTNSPLDHKGFFDATKYNLAGKQVTLNEIENELLRGNFKEPRFHFVLVCGAVGCPPLISEAYLPNTLENQLEEQTKKAINGDFIKINSKKKRIQVSQIMEWYKEDFTMEGKSEIDFINQYLEDHLEGKYKLSYFPYDWKINKQ